MKKSIYIIALFLLVQCKKEGVEQTASTKTDSIKELDSSQIIQDSVLVEKKEISIKDRNDEILQSLKAKDYQKFATYIHPKKGISFSMYGYSDPTKDKHFSREEFSKYIDKRTKFTWGEKDGIGDLMVVSIKDYLNDWVFVKDFTKSNFYLNEFKGSGNSLNNLKKIYPNLTFTENYIPGTAEFSEMDWNCLRFVFDEFEGQKYLVAVINDQWTI